MRFEDLIDSLNRAVQQIGDHGYVLNKHRELTVLTKREQFVLAAMQGLVAAQSQDSPAMWRQRVPHLAIEIADATILRMNAEFEEVKS